jgi:DNA-binding transcriptional MerR regulator
VPRFADTGGEKKGPENVKVGELARHTGMTVRMLRHYDSIGLLKPSGRTEAGYRLYDRDDVTRLHSIQTLRQLGLPLQEITRLLEGRAEPLDMIIQRQISALEHQIEQAGELCARLRLLKSSLAERGAPDMAEWLSMLGSMSTYGKYFTASELKRIFDNWKRTQPEWAVLIGEIRDAMAAGIAPESLDIQPLAQRWMDLSIRWMEGDFELMERWQKMYLREPTAKGKGGADLNIVLYINQAIDVRLTALRKYFTLDELQRVQRADVELEQEWAALGAEARQLVRKKTPPGSGPAKKFTARWRALVDRTTGGDAALRDRYLQAFGADPVLRHGPAFGPALHDFVRLCCG